MLIALEPTANWPVTEITPFKIASVGAAGLAGAQLELTSTSFWL
jgi:hypothetical protein